MAFELVILLTTVVLPTAVMAITFTAALGLPQAIREGGSVALGTFASALSIWLAASLRNGFFIWPTDSWLRVPIGAILVALAGSATRSSGPRESRWVVRSISILTAAWLVLPGDEGFSDLLPSMPHWLLSMSLAAILGWWAIEQVEDRFVLNVAFAWLVLMGAGTFLVAQSFAKLTEVMLAVGTVYFIAGLIACWKGQVEIVRAVAGPSLFAFVAAVGNGQFNSFLGLPNWLYVLAFAGPAIVALPNLISLTRIPRWCRTAILGILTVATAMIIVIYSQSIQGGDEW